MAHRIPYKAIFQAVIGLAALAVVAVYAFALMFTTFGAFDDDGYFLQAYREFLSGRTAYDQVFAFYGPFTFYGGALIARFNAIHVTHDTFRWAYLAAWITIALLLAGIVWRWTKQFAPAVIAFFLIGFRLLALAVSVGHPQVWVMLAVALLLWVGIDWIYQPGPQWRAFCAGSLLALVVLCKINIGVFVAVAIGLTVSLLLRGRLRTLTTTLFLTAAIVLGLMVFVTSSVASEKCFALVYILSLAATTAIAVRRVPGQTPSVNSLLWLALGFVTWVVAGVGLILLYGTTARGLFNALIVYPALLAKSYHLPYLGGTGAASVVISIAGVISGAAVFYRHRLDEQLPVWLAPLKVAAGAGLLFAFIRWPGGAFTGSFLFFWLLLADDAPIPQSRYANRLFLVVLSLLFSLQFYPVAGSQLVWAELLPILVACVLMADGVSSIQQSIPAVELPLLVRTAALGIGPLFAILLFVPCGKAAVARFRQWQYAQPLALPGAHRLRLTPVEIAALEVPVDELRRNCGAVLTVPGMYSYSIWSGVPPFEERRINSWPFLWPNEALQHDLPRIRAQDQGCVLVNARQYYFFKNIAVSRGNDELLSEIRRTMTPIFTLGDVTLYKATALPGSILHSEVADDPGTESHAAASH